jgi:hypothetical protein
MANLERANRFFYTSEHNVCAVISKTKPRGYDAMFVEISAMVSDQIPANKIIELDVVLGFSELRAGSPTIWQRLARVWTEDAPVDEWTLGWYLFKHLPKDSEGICTVYVERRNDPVNANGDPATTIDLYVRRTTVFPVEL